MKLGLVTLLLIVTVALAQEPAARQSGVLRLRVRVKADDSSPLRGLARKRFFLIPGTLDQNRPLIAAIEQQPLTTRDCYYKQHGASEEIINWLRDGDSECV